MSDGEQANGGKQVVIEVRDLVVGFGDHIVLDHLDLDVYRGEILGFVGGSGAGKSVLMRTIIGLLPKRAGTIKVFGVDLARRLRRANGRRSSGAGACCSSRARCFPRSRCGKTCNFRCANISSCRSGCSTNWRSPSSKWSGWTPSVCDKFPSELSGGMTKRVALARALALDPEIVFLDEPTSGLDPIGAGDFDTLIATLQRTLGLTVFMVTHDLDSLHTVCDRIAVLADGKVIAAGTMDTMLASDASLAEGLFPRQAVARGPSRKRRSRKD